MDDPDLPMALEVAPAGALSAKQLVRAPLPSAQVKAAVTAVLQQPVRASVRPLLVSSTAFSAGRSITVVATGLGTAGRHAARYILQNSSSRLQALVGVSDGIAAGVVTLPTSLTTGTWYLAVEDLSGIKTSGRKVSGTAAVDLGIFTVATSTAGERALAQPERIPAHTAPSSAETPSTTSLPLALPVATVSAHQQIRPFSASSVASAAANACDLVNERIPEDAGFDEPVDFLDDGLWSNWPDAARTIRTSFGERLSGIDATDSDRFTLEILAADNDSILAAWTALSQAVGQPPALTAVDLFDGSATIVGAYQKLRDAYLVAGADFLAAGLPKCATPLIVVVQGPGQTDADGDPVEYHITASCQSINTVWETGQNASRTLETGKGDPLTLGTTTDPYGASRVIHQADAQEAVITTDDKYWIYAVSCPASAAGSVATTSDPEPDCTTRAETGLDKELKKEPPHPWPIPASTLRGPAGTGMQVVIEASAFDAGICEQAITASLADPALSSDGQLSLVVASPPSGEPAGPFVYDLPHLAWASNGIPAGQDLKTTFSGMLHASYGKVDIDPTKGDAEIVLAQISLQPLDNEIKLIADGSAQLSASIGPELSVSLVYRQDPLTEDGDDIAEGESTEAAAEATADQAAVEAQELLSLELDSLGLTSDQTATVINNVETQVLDIVDEAELAETAAITEEGETALEDAISADELDAATAEALDAAAGETAAFTIDDIFVLLIAAL